MTIVTFLSIVGFGLVWADRFEPFEDFKNWIGLGKKQEELKFRNKIVNYVYHFIRKVMNCYCIIPYIIFFMTFNVFLACAGYIVAELIYVVIDWFRNNTFYQ